MKLSAEVEITEEQKLKKVITIKLRQTPNATSDVVYVLLISN